MSTGGPPQEEPPKDEKSPSDSKAQQQGDERAELDLEAIGNVRFARAGDVRGGLVAVTGSFEGEGAPGDELASLVKQAWLAIKEAGYLAFSPRALAAVPVGSIAVVFGEPPQPPDQLPLRVSPLWEAGKRVADLIPLADDELFRAALKLGKGAQGYIGLVRLAQTAGITIEWEVRGTDARVLTPDRAGIQYENLTRPAELRTHEMPVRGLLYRAIFEERGKGKAAIHLAKSSAVPPQARGSFVVMHYNKSDVEDLVLHGLLGKFVKATLRIEEPVPNTAIKPELPPAVLTAIEGTESEEQLEIPTIWPDDDDDNLGRI
jgi:hypothetical protein